MANLLSIADTIEVGDVSTYLSANETNKNQFYGGNMIKEVPPVQIALVTDALRWGNEGGAETTASLRTVANYLYWLCGGYQLQAQRVISGPGGGSVVPTPAGGTLPYPLDFIVSGSSPIPDGGLTVNISSFIGYNVEFTRGGLVQYTTDPGDGSTWYSWNRVTGDLTISHAAATGEQMRIAPL